MEDQLSCSLRTTNVRRIRLDRISHHEECSLLTIDGISLEVSYDKDVTYVKSEGTWKKGKK